MADKEESSVMFSLKELMNLEEDRIKSEEDDRIKAQQDVERGRVDAEHRAREAEDARLRADEERRRVDEQRGREEQARLEAIRHAEIEKSRAESEQRARMEEIARHQEHERQLAALKQSDGRNKLRNQLFFVSTLGVLGLGGLGYFVYDQSNKAAQAKLAADQDKQRGEQEVAVLKKKNAQFEEEKKTLEEQLASAPTAEDKKRLEAKLAELEAAKGGAPAVPGYRPAVGAAPLPPVVGAKKCKKGDPTCVDF